MHAIVPPLSLLGPVLNLRNFSSVPLGPSNLLEQRTIGPRMLLHVLMLRDFERADRIGEFWSYLESRTFAELLIDCDEDRTLRAVLVEMLIGAPRRIGSQRRPTLDLRPRIAGPVDARAQIPY